MASLASLATMGSARVNLNSNSFSEGLNPPIGRPLRFRQCLSGRKQCSFSSKHCHNRLFRIPVHCCISTTGLLEEEVKSKSKSKSFSSESYLKQQEGSDDDDGVMALKPSPKPMVRRVESSPNVEIGDSKFVGARWAPKPEVSRDDKEDKQLGNSVDNSAATKKLEEEKKDALDGNRNNAHNYNYKNNDKGPKTIRIISPPPLKNVWKKGNPLPYFKRTPTPVRSMPSSPAAVATSLDIKKNEEGDLVAKIKKEGELEDKIKKEGDLEAKIKKEWGQEEVQRPVSGEVVSAATVSMQSPPLMVPPLRFKPPSPPDVKPENELQWKPMPVKKQVILKDVGAGPRDVLRRPVTLRDIGAAPKMNKTTTLESYNATYVDVDAPVKPSVGGKVSKGKEDWSKKKRPGLGLREAEIELDDEEAEKLDIPIFGGAKKKGRKFSKASRKAARYRAARAAAPVRVEILEVGKRGMSVVELASNLAVHEGEVLTTLFMKGIASRVTETLDQDTVKLVCKEYDVEVIEADDVRVEDMARKKEILDEDDLDKLESRPPVLTIMGHVDHGKTTLLDYIRKSKVAASEAGGITQGIGAYRVLVPVDNAYKSCVFLDTPGHEAFSAMRARGARVTDIAIIVVAADDGVRPQTNEAIAHAKAANVPVVVAINKIDKEGASPERVMQELSSIGLMPEEWGGDVPMVQVSARTGENVNELLETVMLVAELQELKANPNRNAKGTVIEAGLHKSRGPLATFLVQNGTLEKGDMVVCGQSFGKVRALLDDNGNRVDKAGPSIAVQVIGLNKVPVAGDEFEVVDTLDIARERADECALKLRDERLSAQAGEAKVTLSGLAEAITEGRGSGLDRHQFNIVLKVDVQGSVEAIREALSVLPQDCVNLRFLMQAVGDLSTSDVDLALASEAIIVGFNVKVPTAVQAYADHENVEIRMYRIIYELVDDMRKAMEGLLKPDEEQVHIGSAEVRAVFSSGSGRAAGCMVTEGKVVKGCGVRVVRNGTTIHTSTLDSLRRVKEVVKEISAGSECGIGVRDFDDWHVQDRIEAFNSVARRRTLEEASATIAAAVAATGFQQ